jgi:choline-sulfatase
VKNLYFLSVALLLSSCSRPEQGNVILIIVDTLRADHLGCYGYERETTPCIDSLASAGVRYLNVTAGEPWTLPSMATIFTGLLPLEHNARRRGDSYFGLSPDAVTLTEYMAGAGYSTAAFFNVIFMGADFGLHQGFDHFDCFSTLGSENDRNAEQTVDVALQWIDTEYDGDPLFLAVHFYDPHLTYTPPDSFADLWRDPDYCGEFNSSWGQRETVVNVNRGVIGLQPDDLYNLEALYDGEIAYTDNEIRRLLAGLRERGVTDRALVILVADHGEEFLDHDKMGHAHTLYQELLHVPLVISGTGFSPGSVCSMDVSQADILPTVLNWCKIRHSYQGFGCDLLEQMFPSGRAVPSGMSIDESYVVTARRGDLKVHLFDHGTVAFMFNLLSDPGEHDPLEQVDADLLDEARFYLATPPLFNPSAVLVENGFLDALKNLGYI